MSVLVLNIDGIALGERWIATEPLVDHDRQGILITGFFGFALTLFRGHIEGSPARSIDRVQGGSPCLREHSNAEITQSEFFVGANEDIFGLDVTVNDVFVMGIL